MRGKNPKIVRGMERGEYFEEPGAGLHETKVRETCAVRRHDRARTAKQADLFTEGQARGIDNRIAPTVEIFTHFCLVNDPPSMRRTTVQKDFLFIASRGTATQKKLPKEL